MERSVGVRSVIRRGARSNDLASLINNLAEVVKLAYTHALGACGATRGGSSPLLGTKNKDSVL